MLVTCSRQRWIKMTQPQSLQARYPAITQSANNFGFEDIVAKAVNDILSALGEDAKQAIYRHLENSCGISRTDIPNRIEDFANAIENTFGTVGRLIEIKIIERLHVLCSDFHYVPKNGQLDFVEYVKDLHMSL